MARAKYVSEKTSKKSVKEEPSKKDEILEKELPKKVKKEFKDTDLIPCLSITVGGLHLIGAKSGDVYHWLNIGDITEVEYRDLLAEVRNHTFYIYDPAFIIQDEDFLKQHDDILVRYGQLYTPSDIENVLSMSANQLLDTLKKMPTGAQNAVRDLAVRKIDNGTLDSVQRIKILDEFFGTEMLLKLTR